MTQNNLRIELTYKDAKLCEECVSGYFNLNLLDNNEFSGEKIIEAASTAASWDNGRSLLFSLNDVYANLGFQPGRSVSWAKRQETLSPGIIRSVLKRSGFKSIQRSGGANVSRYYFGTAERVRS